MTSDIQSNINNMYFFLTKTEANENIGARQYKKSSFARAKNFLPLPPYILETSSGVGEDNCVKPLD